MSDKFQSPVHAVGKADEIDLALGLDMRTSAQIASIIIFSGNIEFHLERAIWRLDGIDPKGKRPRTDAKPIVVMFDMLECHVSGCKSSDVQALITTWCAAARGGFTIRNNIAHGVTSNIGDTLVLMRNPEWQGETRKRSFGDIWCDENTMDLIRQFFAVLLRTIIGFSSPEKKLAQVATPEVLRALREARSILGEFASQDYNPSFEKY
ncbi:hypothetical protein [uncultured Tateyamaria sp.]|uniref:hypothetical protein n=1 Tax=uncultured Tateyamaria sp. TaxID=455651 RepID=UPI00260BD23A|nr:hypothetical protein [uncultured Tateyamaria sp.]